MIRARDRIDLPNTRAELINALRSTTGVLQLLAAHAMVNNGAAVEGTFQLITEGKAIGRGS
jgi:hypothetical protein